MVYIETIEYATMLISYNKIGKDISLLPSRFSGMLMACATHGNGIAGAPQSARTTCATVKNAGAPGRKGVGIQKIAPPTFAGWRDSYEYQTLKEGFTLPAFKSRTRVWDDYFLPAAGALPPSSPAGPAGMPGHPPRPLWPGPPIMGPWPPIMPPWPPIMGQPIPSSIMPP